MDDIIYELLFSDKEEFIFEISNLFEYIEDYKEVLDTITSSAFKGKVEIIKDVIEIDDENILWKINIKRK